MTLSNSNCSVICSFRLSSKSKSRSWLLDSCQYILSISLNASLLNFAGIIAPGTVDGTLDGGGATTSLRTGPASPVNRSSPRLVATGDDRVGSAVGVSFTVGDLAAAPPREVSEGAALSLAAVAVIAAPSPGYAVGCPAGDLFEDIEALSADSPPALGLGAWIPVDCLVEMVLASDAFATDDASLLPTTRFVGVFPPRNFFARRCILFVCSATAVRTSQNIKNGGTPNCSELS